jgi:hypothetical protein
MSRIRSLKPEFWISEQISELSTTARLLFIGMWNFCDDQGIHPASVKRIKMELLAGDNFALEEVKGWIDEIKAQGLIIEYVVNQVSYWQVTGWSHQRIDRPNKKYPLPQKQPEEPLISEKFEESSTTAPEPLEDLSPEDRKGEEGKGEEGNKNISSPQNSTTEKNALPAEKKNDDAVISPSVEPEQKTAIGLMLISGREHTVFEKQIKDWQQAYPDVDVWQQLLAMRQWCLANPTKRKNFKGINRFIVNWLSKNQREHITRPMTLEESNHAEVLAFLAQDDPEDQEVNHAQAG